MSLKRLLVVGSFVVLMLVMFASGWVVGRTGIGAAIDRGSLSERERLFAERMSGASLVGLYDVNGRRSKDASADRYDLSTVEKVGGNLWRFGVRMQHDTFDVTMPVTVPMEWVGDTPVVMLSDYTIPGLGTFTARVFFYDDRYAGTWQHGQEVGGHLFGRIEK